MKTKEPYFYLELSSISVHRQTPRTLPCTEPGLIQTLQERRPVREAF